MTHLYAKSVFFVRDAALSLSFYLDTLGFNLDWKHEHEGRPHVFQVSLLGLELIINQTEPDTTSRPGHGRLFIGLSPEEAESLKQHVDTRHIRTTLTHWGAPTVVVHDLDQNEIFLWLPESEHAKWEIHSDGAA